MRIVIIYLGRRGSGGPLSLSMAEALTKDAEILGVVSEYSESLEAWKESGIELVIVSTYRNIIGALGEWIYPASSRLLSQKIRNWKPDVVLFPMFFTWNPLIQRQLRGVPSIVAVHDPVPHPDVAGYVYGYLERWSMHQASRVIVFSRTFVSELAQKGFDVSKIDVIPHGELSYYHRFQDDLAEADRIPHPATVLFFGRITAYKGLDILLQAFRVIQAKKAVALIIAGSGDLRPYQKYLKGLANVEIQNRWLAEHEIPGIFKRASMVVLPYKSGSQSGVLALAASYGLPVIATRTGGVREQLEDKKTGLLIEPNSIQELGNAILSLLDNPAAANKMGRNLQKEFSEQNNWENIGKRILAICHKAV